MVITFDDGFQNTYSVAFPFLLEARRPATLVPVTGLINIDDTPWHRHLNLALAETRDTHLEGIRRRFGQSTPDIEARAGIELQASLKGFPHPRLELRRFGIGADHNLGRLT